MTNKKVFLGMLIMALLLSMVTTGCTTTVPVLYSDNLNREFTILGEVIYKPSGGGNQGLIEFLEEARKQYPETDYVIDVMVDNRTTRLLWIFNIRSNWFRGTAIKYNHDLVSNPRAADTTIQQ